MNPIARSYVDEDLQQIRDVFKTSMMSVCPNFLKIFFFFNLPLLVLFKWFGVIIFCLTQIINIVVYLFIRNYIKKTDPILFIDELKTGKIIVIEYDNKIVGWTSLQLSRSSDLTPHVKKSFWTTYFFIHPSYQHSGFGLILCRAMYKCTIANECNEIWGATSSWQTSQIKLHQKYNRELKLIDPEAKFYIKREYLHWLLPIHRVYLIHRCSPIIKSKNILSDVN